MIRVGKAIQTGALQPLGKKNTNSDDALAGDGKEKLSLIQDK